MTTLMLTWCSSTNWNPKEGNFKTSLREEVKKIFARKITL